MIQGSLTGDFSKYTAMTVIDRQNLDKILANQAEAASANYSDNDYVSIGNITNAQYIIIGKLTKIPDNNYFFELGISDSSKGERIASYSPHACSYEQLATMSIVKAATGDLLNQLEIVLTNSGKTALAQTTSVTVNSETALSKGLAAQRQGTVVEAMSYYYSALSYDSSLREASVLLNKLSSDISSGNIGENVRNDIERRKQWIAITEECNSFFKERIPYEIIYNPVLTQGNVDYQNETVNLFFPMIVQPNKDDFKIIQDILTGLDKTGKRREWGLQNWPLTSDTFVDAMIGRGTTPIADEGYRTARDLGLFGISYAAYGIERTEYRGGNSDYGKSITIRVSLINSSGKTISTTTKTFFQSIEIRGAELKLNYDEPSGGRSYNYVMTALNLPMVFNAVPSNDITDNLTIKFESFNGVNIESINSHIKISTGRIKVKLYDDGRGEWVEVEM
jgi:hypothetical protein